MRGFLLERHPRVTDMLACAFAHVGISLVRVTSLEALLDAADTAGPDEFLIIDLTMDGPDDLGRYAPVLGQAVVPVHTVYRDQAIPLLLAHAAASLVLLSVDTSWFALLDKLEALQRQAGVVAEELAGPVRDAVAAQLPVGRGLHPGPSRAGAQRELAPVLRGERGDLGASAGQCDIELEWGLGRLDHRPQHAGAAA